MLTNLETIRRARGLSQSGLARLTGLSQPAVSSFELGTRNPRPATVKLLALVLDCQPEDLYRKPAELQGAAMR